MWIVVLVLTCLFLGAVLASAAGARGQPAGPAVGGQPKTTATSGAHERSSDRARPLIPAGRQVGAPTSDAHKATRT